MIIQSMGHSTTRASSATGDIDANRVDVAGPKSKFYNFWRRN